MSELGPARDRFVALARGVAAGRSGEPDALRARRGEALAAFADAGFPSTRQEEWRYTDLAPVARIPFELAAPGPVDRAAVEAIAAPFFACSAFVFVDGRFAPELSTPGGGAGGVRVRGLASGVPAIFGTLADEKQHSFAALNTALFSDGTFLEVPAGLEAPQPIHLVFVSTGGGAPRATFPRVAIEAAPGSRALRRATRSPGSG
ncbi:MAG TPA: hypothetical protein VNE71_01620 [Myxococcota bacterium]|nr:hypothetical protein [Myxococcota bacterium]